jgi:rhamnosyltransferase
MDVQTCWCVLITFNPEHERLEQALHSILLNTPNLLVVDNASQQQSAVQALCHKMSVSIGFVGLQRNGGIAEAQNRGIAQALAKGASHIWFSDQDSIYPSDYLVPLLQGLADAPMPVAAIGPLYLDEGRGRVQPLVRFDFFSSKHAPRLGLNPVAHVISSGMVVPANVLKLVGGMAQELFIDWVDMEWCWRAHKLHGLVTLVHGGVCMSHRLGDRHVTVLGRKIVLRSPVRHYYMVRNAMYLALWSPSLHAGQRLELFAKACIWSTVFTCIARGQRLQNLQLCLRGLRDGFLRDMGPMRS